MTDKEVIKALEYLRTSTLNGWREKKITEKDLNIISYALDLINRQKAEIDKLKIEICALSEKRITFPERLKIAKHARKEAIKEFVERLKNLIYPQLSISTYEKGEAFHFCLDEIDSLVKQITESEK